MSNLGRDITFAQNSNVCAAIMFDTDIDGLDCGLMQCFAVVSASQFNKFVNLKVNTSRAVQGQLRIQINLNLGHAYQSL
jgi:hypothetical protein